MNNHNALIACESNEDAVEYLKKIKDGLCDDDKANPIVKILLRAFEVYIRAEITSQMYNLERHFRLRPRKESAPYTDSICEDEKKNEELRKMISPLGVCNEIDYSCGGALCNIFHQLKEKFGKSEPHYIEGGLHFFTKERQRSEFGQAIDNALRKLERPASK